MALGAGDYATCFQFLVNSPARGFLDGRGATHGTAGAMASRAERSCHAAGLANEHPARCAHVAGNDYRLTDPAIEIRDFRVIGRKGACRPLAMDPNPFAFIVDRMLLELGDVMANIVNQVHLHFLPGAAEYFGEYFPSLLHEQLAIAPRKIGRGPHGANVFLS